MIEETKNNEKRLQLKKWNNKVCLLLFLNSTYILIESPVCSLFKLLNNFFFCSEMKCAYHRTFQAHDGAKGLSMKD